MKTCRVFVRLTQQDDSAEVGQAKAKKCGLDVNPQRRWPVI